MTSKGVEIRAQIDTENLKALLLVNGGGSVALLTFLSQIFGKSDLGGLISTIMWALLLFLVGLAAALVHARLRRVCSLVYEGNQYQPPRCRFFPTWLRRKDPCVCAASIAAMWLSWAAFVFGGLLVFAGGLANAYHSADSQTACWQLHQIHNELYRMNQCTGVLQRLNP